MSFVSAMHSIWRGVTFAPRWVWAKVRRTRQPKYCVIVVEDFPDAKKSFAIYLAGDQGLPWGAAMLCPCGCGDTIELNLLPQVRPRWTVQIDKKRTVTLMPSVWRKKGCKSHFFVRKGMIEWC